MAALWFITHKVYYSHNVTAVLFSVFSRGWLGLSFIMFDCNRSTALSSAFCALLYFDLVFSIFFNRLCAVILQVHLLPL